MSLFDSLNTFAKNVGDKANEALEVNRLNGKINTEKTQIQQELKKIGEYYYKSHTEGQEYDPDVTEILISIDKHYATIRETEEQIKLCKGQNQIPTPSDAAPSTQGIPQRKEQEMATTLPSEKRCPSSRKNIDDNLKFCGNCGTKIEPPPCRK